VRTIGISLGLFERVCASLNAGDGIDALGLCNSSASTSDRSAKDVQTGVEGLHHPNGPRRRLIGTTWMVVWEKHALTSRPTTVNHDRSAC
jgi:hypothetical protein